MYKTMYATMYGDFITKDGVLRKYCGNDSHVTIPDNIIAISDFAFYNCCQLESITIPDSVTTIGDFAFCDCPLLTNVVIPSSIVAIGRDAFTFTPWMDSQTDEFVIVGDGVLLGYNGSDTDVVIPNGVKYIGDAFRDYLPLHTVTIPDSVTTISDLAFCGCDLLANVIIPDSVVKISDSAFYNTAWLFDV